MNHVYVYVVVVVVVVVAFFLFSVSQVDGILPIATVIISRIILEL